MTKPVKKWDHVTIWGDRLQIKSTMMGMSYTGKYVLTTDYERLEQECERLRADMRFLAEYIAAESTGHPLPNYLAVGRFPIDVARAVLSAPMPQSPPT